MAEKKKQKPAAFAQEKKTFTGEIPKKANEGKGKKSAAYQPRDADTTSGHDVQRSKNTKKYQKADASGQNVQKSEGAEAGEKSKSDFMQPDSTFTEEAGEEQGRKIASDDYRHRDTYHSSQKKGRYQRREIKSRERVKQFDFEQDFQTKDTTFKFPVDQILTHRMTPKFQTALRFKGCHLKKCVIYTVFLAETIRIIKPSHRWSHMKRWSPAFRHFFSQFFLYKLLKRSVKCIHLFFSSLSQ